MINARMTNKQRELMVRFNMPAGTVRSGSIRQRCRRCHCYLWITGKKVHAVDGLYCTTNCAQWSVEELDAWNAWWDFIGSHCGCHGSTGRKNMYESEQEAIENIRVPNYMRPYECPKKSGYFHLTKKVQGGT